MPTARFVVLEGPANDSGDTTIQAAQPQDAFEIIDDIDVFPEMAFTTGGLGAFSTSKTFTGPVKAALVNQGLTYTAITPGAAGDSITIELFDPEDNDIPLSVETTGTNIVVTLETDGGGLIVSTADDVKALINGDIDASALVFVSGSGMSALTALVQTPLASGNDGKVDTTNDILTISAHGFNTGLKVRATTNGTLPTGIALLTDYFVVVLTANTIKLASSLSKAYEGEGIDITGVGSYGGTHTLTAVNISGTFVCKTAKLIPPDERPNGRGIWFLGFVSGEDTGISAGKRIYHVDKFKSTTNTEGGKTYQWYIGKI